MTNKKKIEQIRIDFSFKREVFFVVVGAIVGAITFIIPKTIFETQMGLPYYLSWIVFGHIVGVYSSQSIIAGVAIHMLTAISIGIVVGIFLYKTGILNISKLSNGILYGLLAGTAVFVMFYIPVQQLVLTPETARTLVEMESSPHMTVNEAAKEISDNFLAILVGSVITHLVFGVTVGIISSLLSIRFGSRYRCSICDISFSRIDSYQKHIEAIHGAEPIKQKHILILGGGFGGVQILREVQKEFQNDVSIDITLVSKDNFFLFTPMLPEVSSGMIETRHIATPIRGFCKRARFYEANVKSIDLDKKEVSINHSIGKESSSSSTHTLHSHILKYDYLILALGGETNFFGMTEVAKNAFTIKTLDDAIILRNHVINMLEQADIEYSEHNPRKSLMTFVVVGGGFSGVETAGELNDFVRDSIKHFYHNIDSNDVKIIVVNSGARLLPEVTEDLSEFTLQKLRANGVEVMLNTRVVSADKDSVKLNNDSEIICHTLIWAGGVTPEPLIASLLSCKHDKSGRLIANNYLEVQGIEERGEKGEGGGGVKHTGIFVLGDCASIIDPNTNKPCPPTAQHAIRQGKVAARNLISIIKQQQQESVEDHDKKISYDYRTKGMMAKIGKRNGVGILLGHRIQGFSAWWLWRSYYLANLPTIEKKLRVIVDWSIDIFFKRDVTRLKTFVSEEDEGVGGEERFKTETEKTTTKKEEILH
jgi:NADH dehydrogenase FAD-containing subunit